MKILFAFAFLYSVILAQTFRSATTLVRAEALVEENGRAISGLQSEDFIILDEGRPQPVANFAAESGSVRLVLLLDSSGSMRPAMRQLAQTGFLALSVLHPDDLVALMTFDRRGTLRVPLTADRKTVIEGISKATGKTPDGGTDIYRALSDAARYLLSAKAADKEIEAPNVILILTDNAARADTTEASTLRDLWAASAAVDALVVSSGPLWSEDISRSLAGTKLQDVRRIADQTGGVVRQTPEAETALQAMIERARTRYTVYFRQPETAQGVLHHMKVDLSDAARTKHPAAVVRSRTAYYSE